MNDCVETVKLVERPQRKATICQNITELKILIS